MRDVIRPMPVPNVVAVGGLANRVLRCESPVFKGINELAFKAAYDLVIPVSPEGDGQPYSVLYKPALVETTLRLRLVDGLLSASPPRTVLSGDDCKWLRALANQW